MIRPFSVGRLASKSGKSGGGGGRVTPVGSVGVGMGKGISVTVLPMVEARVSEVPGERR